MFLNQQRFREVLIAGSASLICAVILYVSVSSLAQEKKMIPVFVMDQAHRFFCITYNDLPVGRAEALLLSSELDSIVFMGSISSSEDKPSTFTADISFNSLGQLYSGSFSLKHPSSFETDISLAGVKRSSITFSASSKEGPVFNQETEIKGPLLMRNRHASESSTHIEVVLPSENLHSGMLMNQASRILEQNIHTARTALSAFTLTETTNHDECILRDLPEELHHIELQILSGLQEMGRLLSHKDPS
jgi:hypothetical protein